MAATAALLRCNTCGGAVAAAAAACPHCGNPAKKKPSKIITIGGGFLGVCIALAILAPKSQQPTAPAPVSVASQSDQGDRATLETFASALRQEWDRDGAAYAAYRLALGELIRKKDVAAAMPTYIRWDDAVRDVEKSLAGVVVPRTANGELRALMEEAVREFRDALAHERKASQNAMVMLTNRRVNMAALENEIREMNLSSVRSALALANAYRLLGIAPPGGLDRL